MEQHNSFCYTYSAQQQKEVEAIRRKYLPREEDKMAQLRRLHSIPTRKAVCTSIGIGVPGLLLLGTGMSLCMTELGDVLGIYAMAVGIGVGLAGIALAALAYPVYNLVLKRQREKIAPQILLLTDELLK